MGEGKPNGEAQANVSQEAIHDQGQWNTGTTKDTGDAATQGIFTEASDANAGAGGDTSLAQQTASTTDPRPAAQGGDANPSASPSANPSTYGSMKDGGLPASGAATDPAKTVDGDDKS